MIRTRLVRGIYRTALELPARVWYWLLTTQLDDKVCETSRLIGGEDE